MKEIADEISKAYKGHIDALEERIIVDTKTIDDADARIDALKVEHEAALKITREATPTAASAEPGVNVAAMRNEIAASKATVAV